MPPKEERKKNDFVRYTKKRSRSHQISKLKRSSDLSEDIDWFNPHHQQILNQPRFERVEPLQPNNSKRLDDTLFNLSKHSSKRAHIDKKSKLTGVEMQEPRISFSCHKVQNSVSTELQPSTSLRHPMSIHFLMNGSSVNHLASCKHNSRSHSFIPFKKSLSRLAAKQNLEEQNFSPSMAHENMCAFTSPEIPPLDLVLEQGKRDGSINALKHLSHNIKLSDPPDLHLTKCKCREMYGWQSRPLNHRPQLVCPPSAARNINVENTHSFSNSQNPYIKSRRTLSNPKLSLFHEKEWRDCMANTKDGPYPPSVTKSTTFHDFGQNQFGSLESDVRSKGAPLHHYHLQTILKYPRPDTSIYQPLTKAVSDRSDRPSLQCEPFQSISEVRRKRPYGAIEPALSGNPYVGSVERSERYSFNDVQLRPMKNMDTGLYSRGAKVRQHISHFAGGVGREFLPTTPSLPSTCCKTARKKNSHSINENIESQWSPEIEQRKWLQMSTEEKRGLIAKSIWDIRKSIRSESSSWPPLPNNFFTIRCMHASFAQRSYGNEKRFLCPPPIVKISDPLQQCQWVSVRVIHCESAASNVAKTTLKEPVYDQDEGKCAGRLMDSSIDTTVTQEFTIPDRQGVAMFKKLHVGSSHQNASSKMARLQVNILHTKIREEESNRALRSIHDCYGSINIPSNIHLSFHCSPFNVVSKAARKSAPARTPRLGLNSGTIVCLYNRLKSQTTKTKFLKIESESRNEMARKLITSQDGWDAFSIELLAHPLSDNPIDARLLSDDSRIYFGSIVCLRDVNSNLCSDPMLLCKADKGKVRLPNVLSSSTDKRRFSFQVTSKNRKEALRILLGGARKRSSEYSTHFQSTPGGCSSMPKTAGFRETNDATRVYSEVNDTGIPRFVQVPPHFDQVDRVATGGERKSCDVSPGDWERVTQLQKVSLMLVTPLLSSDCDDKVECDLQASKMYLCSQITKDYQDESSELAIARSQTELLSRSFAVHKGIVPLDLNESIVSGTTNGTLKGTMAASSICIVGGSNADIIPSNLTNSTQSVKSQISYVRFSKHPTLSLYTNTFKEDFCWSIVEVLCTERSYLRVGSSTSDKNPSSGVALNSSSARIVYEQHFPQFPSVSLPIVNIPCLEAQPSYNARSHSVAANIHHFFYEDDSNDKQLSVHIDSVNAMSVHQMAHEVWIGQLGPLQTHASPAVQHASEVIIQLPNMEQLIHAHIDFHFEEEKECLGLRKEKSTDVIKLQISFVRLLQGITFPSGYWLLAEYHTPSQAVHDSSWLSKLDPFNWSFRVM